MPTFPELKASYTELWQRMKIRSDKIDIVDSIVHKLCRHKAKYQAVEAKTGVPWFVIAALHNRESDADFNTYLGNGEPLDRVTRLVPKGRGPFATWQDGAIDALNLDGLDRVRDWSPERACFEIEKFNGFGYQRMGRPSPYLWSYSNNYERGKYVADGKFDPNAIDKQCGAIPILKRIMERDSHARFPAKSRVVETTAGAGAIVAGGAAAKQAIEQGASYEAIIAIIIIAACVVAISVYGAIRWWRNRG